MAQCRRCTGQYGYRNRLVHILTVPLPKNSNVVLFLNFGNTEGKITLKGANGATKTQDITVKNNHVLMHFGAMGDSVTIIPEITKGEFRILGIGIEK